MRRDFKPWFDELDFRLQVGDGWRGLLCDLTVELERVLAEPEGAPEFRATQVKEKLGELRIHVRNIPVTQATAVHAAITRAEERSVHICETCGRAGRLRQSHAGYWRTACDEHVIN